MDRGRLQHRDRPTSKPTRGARRSPAGDEDRRRIVIGCAVAWPPRSLKAAAARYFGRHGPTLNSRAFLQRGKPSLRLSLRSYDFKCQIKSQLAQLKPPGIKFFRKPLTPIFPDSLAIGRFKTCDLRRISDAERQQCCADDDDDRQRDQAILKGPLFRYVIACGIIVCISCHLS
jgi:hypothetical protein